MKEFEEQQDFCCKEMEDGQRMSQRSESTTSALVARLNRIEGQIRGIRGMIEKGVYCDDILIQVSAVQSAINGVSKLILESHMKTCVANRIQEGDLEVIDEFLKTVNKMIK